MILFVQNKQQVVYAVSLQSELDSDQKERLSWLLDGTISSDKILSGTFLGPRREMITPWSTNAVEITQNMGISGVIRIEAFLKAEKDQEHDPMLQVIYDGLNQDIFQIDVAPEPIKYIEDIAGFNEAEGLALSPDEVGYLDGLALKLDRKLTDSEVFGFSQVNSEHCRHKIFNGIFEIDGKEMPSSLFRLIRDTTEANNNTVVSAYKDNVAFLSGPTVEQFAPKTQNSSDYFETSVYESTLSIKAETHNFPTTVEPFNGAATGAGGEIRDRMAGGKGSMPLAGTAVYMTPYSRLADNRPWENGFEKRNWLYQSPIDLLIKASNGASDFGNKFGQPLIAGSVLTFEHSENESNLGYDKVIMLAGGIGYGINSDVKKATPQVGDKIVVMGGDNYRIGMGGAAVSSVDTGKFSSGIELNAIQRSNPEMQKRVYNAVRAMAESGKNPIVSIHDHGAGGHLNCLSELVEETGGKIAVNKLPIGDPTLSAKEIIGNESQERMGLVIREEDLPTLQAVAERERAPMYVVGDVTGDHQFTFDSDTEQEDPINLQLADMFGNPPKTVMRDSRIEANFSSEDTDIAKVNEYLEKVLKLESVACKDWLTNKVDRSVTGRVAKQQTCGELQLPLNNVGVMALDFRGASGLATSIGHAPVVSLINPKAGARIAIAESLTNLVFAPMKDGLKSASLSANWMWPCNNPGEDARLYDAVEATSDFAQGLGINIPTGKDSLSMVQKYKDGKKVLAPGTVIISAGGEVSEIKKIVSTNLQPKEGTELLYIDLSSAPMELGGSALNQVLNKVGSATPDILDTDAFKKGFNAIQDLIKGGHVLAGHDVSSGGLITALLEMCFPTPNVGLFIDTAGLGEKDYVKALFAENPAIILQVEDAAEIQAQLEKSDIGAAIIGNVIGERQFTVVHNSKAREFDIDSLRDVWFETSYLLDKEQSTPALAKERYDNYKTNGISYDIAANFTGQFKDLGLNPDRKDRTGAKAAIIREKGVNGDREMAYSMHLAGFDVKDVHMTDLISGRETLEDISFIVFVGGFSNSDVLGSAKGWAGAFKYNEKAKSALENFYARPDTLSLGVCNGCQLMMELGLINNELAPMKHNDSGKFESTFLSVEIPKNDSIMLKNLNGSKLGIWVAHGEGKFTFKGGQENHIALKYNHDTYPANPNGSELGAAGVSSEDGRHLAMMPHLERSIFPWQCGHYPEERKQEDVTPWIQAFINAKNWIEEKA